MWVYNRLSCYRQTKSTLRDFYTPSCCCNLLCILLFLFSYFFLTPLKVVASLFLLVFFRDHPKYQEMELKNKKLRLSTANPLKSLSLILRVSSYVRILIFVWFINYIAISDQTGAGYLYHFEYPSFSPFFTKLLDTQITAMVGAHIYIFKYDILKVYYFDYLTNGILNSAAGISSMIFQFVGKSYLSFGNFYIYLL